MAFTFKQWGTWGPDGVRRDQKANGRLLAGQVWDERPELSGALLERDGAAATVLLEHRRWL